MAKRSRQSKKTGRPRYEPNDEARAKVRLMAAAGMTADKIALALDIGKTTLYEHYKKEIQNGGTEATVQVAGNLFRLTKTHPAAAIFWMKTRAGWRETLETETADTETHLHFHSTEKPERYNKPDEEKDGTKDE